MPRLAVSLACFAVLLASGCAEPTPGERSLLLVTFDTTRADRIGAYGHATAATPALDALAASGLRFESVLAPAPITLPSHTSILTGLPPAVHGVRDNGLYTVSPEAVLVSERLSEAGWRTGAFVGSFTLDARFGLNQGFEVYDGPSEHRRLRERPASEVVDAAIAWLDSLPAGERFFCWVHFFDPHEPFEVPDDFRSSAQGEYDSQIAYADSELGRLLAHLEARRGDQEIAILATADHGEALGEHGEPTHGTFVYQSTLRVPLVLAGAGIEQRGEVVKTQVGLIDVAPTLLALVGMPPIGEGFGRSLLDAAGAATPAPSERVLRIETWMPYHAYRWRAQRGIVSEDYKLIEGHSLELYDLTHDPNELSDLAETEPDRVADLGERLAKRFAEDGALRLSENREVSDAEREMLEALGYAAGSAGEDPFAADLPDPRERVGDVSLVNQANGILYRGMRAKWGRGKDRPDLFLEAREAFERLRSRNPADPHIAYGLGLSEFGLGNLEAAIPWLEQAVEQDPARADVRDALVRCYAELGREADANRVRAGAAVGGTVSPAS